MDQISIIGAGGHARTIINLLKVLNYEIRGVYDDSIPKKKDEIIDGFPLLGKLSLLKSSDVCVIGKANIPDRLAIFKNNNLNLLKDNLIHPKSIIESKSIGFMNHFSANSFIAESASLGNSNVIYSSSTIEHEVEIGDNNIITSGVVICGRAKLGSNIFLGANCTILPKVNICSGTIVGAGAVVTKSIKEQGTYIGTPAFLLK